MSWLKRKAKTARALLYYQFRKFLPTKDRFLKQVRFRSAEFLVLANEDIGRRLLGFKEYEQSELEALERLIRAEDVCVDVGANIGIFSVFMAKRASKGRVFAFEPIPFNRSILAVNAGLNNVINIEAYDYVLGATVGTAMFSVSEDSAYSSLRPTNTKKEAFPMNVRIETLDSLFTRRNQRIDIIKIDVEGAELMVLKGGNKLLLNPELRPRVLLVELGEQNQSIYGYQPEDVIDYLGGMGYGVHSITREGLKKGWPVEGSPNALFVYED